MAKIIVCLLMIFLTSCAHVKRKDGPPNFYVDETKIKNAVPKSEPLSKLGNMPSYKVFGQRYYTLRSSKNYNKIGVASWYGTQFHEHKTSSGEPYDMLAMTAAHKTLPLPTYVEVTNLKNHRQIIVKVNDRGPFESNRIIDLSYVAAKKLGMLGHGTALVRVKAINPATFGRKMANYVYLRVGNFRRRIHAVRLKKRLPAHIGAPVNISQSNTTTGPYHIQIGPIKDSNTANKISIRLKELGMKPYKISGEKQWES